MSAPFVRPVVLCTAAALALGACKPEDEDARSRVVLTVTTATTMAGTAFLDGVEEQAELHFQVTDAEGRPGTGPLTVVASGGMLDGGERQRQVELQNGEVRLAFTCPTATDAACASGRVSVRGTWRDASGGRLGWDNRTVMNGAYDLVVPVYVDHPGVTEIQDGLVRRPLAPGTSALLYDEYPLPESDLRSQLSPRVSAFMHGPSLFGSP